MNEILKQCSQCSRRLPLIEFYSRKESRDGLRNKCKKCCRRVYASWYLLHALKIKRQMSIWRQNHREYVKKEIKKWVSANKEKVKIYHRKSFLLHREQIYKQQKRWRDNHPDKARRIVKRRYLKYSANLFGRLNQRMSSALMRSLRGKKAGENWEKLVGYGGDELKQHLESQFQEGMSWTNMGKWHIDHIIPLSRLYFDSVDDPTFKFAWSLNNLQPLWAMDNFHKNNKLKEKVA